VIIPTLDEAAGIASVVERLRSQIEPTDELIVVDGGSRDQTVSFAEAAGAKVVTAPSGRGKQMNAAAAVSHGQVLLFVHADTTLSDGFRSALELVLDDSLVGWGRFDIGFDSRHLGLRFIAWMINRRSRLTRGATGDQAIFVRRTLFERVGGFHEPVLFEDVDLCRRLKPKARMGVPTAKAITSARRWENRGILRTVVTMWMLKTAYLIGVPSSRLLRCYSKER